MKTSQQVLKHHYAKLMVLNQIKHSNVPFIPSLKPFDFSLDREVALAVIKQHKGKALKILHENWRNDRELVLKAISNDAFASGEYVGKVLRRDRNFVKELVQVKNNWVLLKDMDEDFRQDEEICRAALDCNPRAIKYVLNQYLLNNREYMLKIVSQCGILLEYVGYSLKNNREINLAALKQTPKAFQFVGNVLFKDEEISSFSTLDNSIELRIKSISGKELRFFADPNNTFNMIRWRVAEEWNIGNEFRIIHNSKVMSMEDDEKTLQELEINSNSKLVMVFRLVGG
ncbi:predicted protein [Naegleria gruberi]|uniref:Predicted protein n=1 Tax=Naegleria gruberi TaxID=5762 RepID=D2VPP1_NAEGR|nr:uncharacterized protein NAEGRDRAFT_51273 [Naegleria gruberi]EFC41239.1 predicted protein [Naegleria gruberi]|eukprot:XP_002673983.1 predicted protein [Naegleria gruberi strain NEG-M]